MMAEDREFLQSEDCILRTGSLTLRRPRAADAARIVRLAHDMSVAANVATMPFPYTGADAEAWIAGAEAGECVAFLAFVQEDGAEIAVGGGGFSAGEGRVPQLGYWVGGDYRGRGHATEIARVLVDYAFDTIGAERVGANCRVTNGPARRVVEKCGFQWAGCGLAGSVGFRGAFPVDRFRLDRRIWDSLVTWGQARAAHWPAGGVSAKTGVEARAL